MIPGLLVAKLYANAIYMVLNSRFQIIGGRDAYMSSSDMSITTTMIRDIIPQPAECVHPAEGMQGQTPVLTTSNEVWNNNYEMGQVSVSCVASCAFLLELILPKGSTTGQPYGPLRVTNRLRSSDTVTCIRTFLIKYILS